LRISLAFSFLYPAIHAVFEPSSWIGYFPQFMFGLVPDEILLHSFGALEILLALWVLSGWKIRIPSMIMALMLLGIVMFNLNQFEVVFRDLSIMGLAIALAVMESATPVLRVRGGAKRP
jgi:uncharacterized membrane protein YphA (DoxX/SURF4 family)